VRPKTRLERTANTCYFILTGKEDKDPAGGKARMDTGRLPYSCVDVVHICAPREVYRDRMLAGANGENRRRSSEERWILYEVSDAEGCRHDDHAERLHQY
jgi:hypothetical protein